MTDRIRVLIADDHPVFRDGLHALVESAAGSRARRRGNHRRRGRRSRGERVGPRSILMDLRMPELSGIEATRRILEADPTVGILIVTMSEDDESLFAAMRAGARGYIPKDAERGEILSAIRAAAVGEAVFGASIARRVADFFAAPRSPAAEPFPDLTERENEILELIAQGRSNGDIAGRLGITSEDRPQPRRERLQQAAGRGPRPGDRPGARGRARARRLEELTPSRGPGATPSRAARLPDQSPDQSGQPPHVLGTPGDGYLSQTATTAAVVRGSDGRTEPHGRQRRHRRLPCQPAVARAICPLADPRRGRSRGCLPGGLHQAARHRPGGRNAGHSRPPGCTGSRTTSS